MNLYAYVGGDPVNATDPSGEFARGDTLFGSCAGQCDDSGGNFTPGGLAGSLFGGGGGGGGRHGGSAPTITVSVAPGTSLGNLINTPSEFSNLYSRGSFSFSGGISFLSFNNFTNGGGGRARNISRRTEAGGDQSQQTKDQPNSCYNGGGNSQRTGAYAGAATLIGIEGPEYIAAILALARGARVAGVLLSLAAGTSGTVVVGVAIVVGVGVYIYDRQTDGSISRLINPYTGECS